MLLLILLFALFMATTDSSGGSTVPGTTASAVPEGIHMLMLLWHLRLKAALHTHSSTLGLIWFSCAEILGPLHIFSFSPPLPPVYFHRTSCPWCCMCRSPVLSVFLNPPSCSRPPPLLLLWPSFPPPPPAPFTCAMSLLYGEVTSGYCIHQRATALFAGGSRFSFLHL